MIDEEELSLDDEALIGDADLDEGDTGEEGEESRQIEGDGGDDADRKTLESEARSLGWKPKSEWKGDQSGWVDADEFLDQVKPARLRDTLHRTSRELAELKRQREAEKRDFEDRLTRLDKLNAKSMERQRAQLLAQLKAAQRQAAEAGDMEAFDHYQQQEVQAQQHFAKEDDELEKAPPQRQQQDQPDPAIDAWVKSNPAVRFNGPKWQAAIAFYSEAEAENPGGSIADHLAHVEQRLNETWPGTIRGAKTKQNGNGGMSTREKGEDDQARRSPQTERSGRIATRQARAKGWTDIPAAERSIMKRHISEGLYKDEADAAKAYWS